MHALFCIDHTFFYGEDGDVFSAGQFPYSLWERYLDFFDELTIVCRGQSLPDRSSLPPLYRSSGPHVRFLFVPSMRGPVALFLGRMRAMRIVSSVIDLVDAVVARLPSETGLVACALAQKYGKPLAVELVGCAWDGLWNHGSLQAKLYAPVRFMRVRAAVNRSPFVLYVSKEFLPSRYPTRGLGACVSDVELPLQDPAVLLNRRRLINQSRTPFVFGLIGRLGGKTKGIQTAIEALAQAKTDLPEFQLRILGEGDPGPWRRLASQHGLNHHVRFCGTLASGQAVREWLDDIDLYLQPSYQEGLPRALIEAMSRGCPAIGSTTGGIPELLPDECLFRPGDSAHLRRLIIAVANDTREQAVQAERNFDEAKEFQREVLDARREVFWTKFLNHIRKP